MVSLSNKLYNCTNIMLNILRCELIFTCRPNDESELTLTLLCRRSRMMAGTRYRRRGLSQSGRGFVANEVQSEVFAVRGEHWNRRALYACILLHRGTIPIFWGHDQTLISQP